jgi:hypothetical protein
MLYFDHFQRNFVKFELTNYVKSTRLTQLYILTSLGKHIQVYSPNCSRQKIDAKLSSEPEKLFLHNYFLSEPEKLYARLHAKLHFSFFVIIAFCQAEIALYNFHYFLFPAQSQGSFL